MKAPTRSPAIKRMTAEARRLGYRVIFREYCECAKTPGVALGRIAGFTDTEDKEIVVRTKGMSRRQLEAILRHELEHANGALIAHDVPELGMRCGGELRPLGGS